MGETLFYKRVTFLEWMQQRQPLTRYDLASSYVYSLNLNELGIEPSQLDLTAKEIKSKYLLAHKYGLEPDNFILTHGASMALYVIYNCILKPGDEVILESPNYEPLYRLAVKSGARIKMLERSPEKDYQIDLEEFQRKISRNTRMVVITNLHNPTGAFTDTDKMQAIADITRDSRSYTLCSEVFLDNVLNRDHEPACKMGSHMISVNSFSKVYGLPELKFGWIVCTNEAIRKRMSILVDQYLGSITPLIDQIATVALNREGDLINRSKEVIKKNIDTVGEWIGKQNELKWIKPEGGSVCLVKLPARINSMNFANYIFEKYKTLVAPGDFFWKSGYIRIAFGQNQKSLKTGLDYISRSIKEQLETL